MLPILKSLVLTWPELEGMVLGSLQMASLILPLDILFTISQVYFLVVFLRNLFFSHSETREVKVVVLSQW